VFSRKLQVYTPGYTKYVPINARLEKKKWPQDISCAVRYDLADIIVVISMKCRNWKKAVAGIMTKDDISVVVQELMSPNCGYIAAETGYFAVRCRLGVVLFRSTRCSPTLGLVQAERIQGGCRVAMPSTRDRGSPISLLSSQIISCPACWISAACHAELGVAVSQHIIFLLQAQQVKVPSITPKLRVRFRESHQSQYHSKYSPFSLRSMATSSPTFSGRVPGQY